MEDTFEKIARLGNLVDFKFVVDYKKILNVLEGYEWKVYNPSKPFKRYGLSLTSLDGGMSGIPDLDSLYEYNKKHNTHYNELSFATPTPLLTQCFGSEIEKFLPYLGRSHFIKLEPGGYFPIHRDQRFNRIKSFRLFLPILNCNVPIFYFILDNQILNFSNHSIYFINTCLPHTVFNASVNQDTIFGVFNIRLSDEILPILDQMLSIR